MRHYSLVILISLMANTLQAQKEYPMPKPYNEDSLRTILESNPHDTTRIELLLQLAGSYFFKQPDTSLLYAMQAVEISRRSNLTIDIIHSVSRAGEAMRQAGMLSAGMKMQLEALERSQKAGNDQMQANSYGFIGMTYVDLESYDYGIYYLKKAIATPEHLRRDRTDFIFRIYMAQAYHKRHEPDSSFYILAEAEEILRRSFAPPFPVLLNNNLGDTFLEEKKIDSANFYYKLAFKAALKYKDYIPNQLSMASYRIAKSFRDKNLLDSGLYYGRYAYSLVRKRKLHPRILEASNVLAQLHEKTGRLDSALYYQKITIAMNDSIYGKNNFNELQLLVLQEQRRNQELQRNEERSKSTQQLIGLVSITGVILIASIMLFRNNRIKQKTNLALQQTLKELKATQSQLIQSEKMASLGELTAGIAHEIQNPLNFVNNFSELNKELIDELNINAKEGKIEAVQRLASDIKENEEKIEQHGKRADAIVKSMLQHSRASSGKKELVDINTLCDEYLRLSYHGYRAKDKSFCAKVNTILDPTIPKVNVMQQDIGRVLLNLINNAFYAVSEMKKLNGDGYEPNVSVETKNLSGKVEIRVTDNGIGVSEKVKEKIFQPFFTTKPTGQGTGLGLSLSYDIVKAHGGTLEVNSKEGEGSEFIIHLLV